MKTKLLLRMNTLALAKRLLPKLPVITAIGARQRRWATVLATALMLVCGGCALTPENKLAITNATVAGASLGLDTLATSRPELAPLAEQLKASVKATGAKVSRDVVNATSADVSNAVAKQIASDIATKVPKEHQRDVAAAVARGLRKHRDNIRSGAVEPSAPNVEEAVEEVAKAVEGGQS